MHIELDRTFRQLSQSKGASSDEEALYPTGERYTWDDLAEEFRVVILSEAGSGKTVEIRETAKRMRGQAKAAFFLRLEYVAGDFDAAFEEGTPAEFDAWLASPDPGWILLDSIDESRLKDPSDFERAIRKISGKLSTAKQRVHLIITGRAPAWRPVTDRALCESQFPFAAEESAKVDSDIDGDEDGDFDEVDDDVKDRGRGDVAPADNFCFKVLSLDNLTREQVERFGVGKGITDIQLFLDAVERADAWSFTARPQDLEELTTFWKEEGRIGTRFELIQKSIDERLKERDQNRDEKRPLSSKKAREGAKLVAALCTLAQQQTIRIPDGRNNRSVGLDVGPVLPDWEATELGTLLARPLFDEAIYGTVRFHHRSVREFLAAEWFSDLLKRNTSRRNIEGVFFRTQYGMEVVVPSVRALLPWLVGFDEELLEKVRKVAPEVLFEGGDPARLPLSVRREILTKACDMLSRRDTNRSMADYAAIQRFAGIDLANDVIALTRTHKANDEVVSFLMRMIWQGRLTDALSAAKSVAGSVRAGRSSRIAAFRAVADLGTTEDMALIRGEFSEESNILDRRLFSELIEHAPPTEEALNWIFKCLPPLQELEQFGIDYVAQEISSFVKRLPASRLSMAINGLHALLMAPPYIERRHCQISTRYRWLLEPAAVAVRQVLDTRDGNSSSVAVLSILRVLPIVARYETMIFDHQKLEFKKDVLRRTDLKWALFWYIVTEERDWLSSHGQRLRNYAQAAIWQTYVSFVIEDFDQAIQYVKDRPSLDDRLVALTLAFNLYVSAGRPRKHRNALKAAASANTELEELLSTLLRPPKRSHESKRMSRSNAAWARKAMHIRLQREENRKASRVFLIENAEKLRDPGFKNKSDISKPQHYLLEILREAPNSGSSSWTQGNWRFLEDEFGFEVASAFRDGAIAYWRHYRPRLVSEGAASNSIDLQTIFGLTGLNIEGREVPNFTAELDSRDVDTAFRYAMHELNGFPFWMPSLFASHAEQITSLSLREIAQELQAVADSPGSQYLLYDLVWSGEWMRDAIAPRIADMLRTSTPRNVTNLRYVLDVIQASKLPDGRVDELIVEKLAAGPDPATAPLWLAAWTGVSPGPAVDALEAQLFTAESVAARTSFAIEYLTRLLGSRHSRGGVARGAFRTPAHLKRLYLLMSADIRRADDIDRANKGAYSPGPRDDAQDAREHLASLLGEIPGKEAFLALSDISRDHPDEYMRPWFALQAKSRAETDANADAGAWSAGQLREFYEVIERTPSNHQQLFELAVFRLSDLKDMLEQGDSSYARILATVKDEIEVRKFVGDWCRDHARGRYTVPQEEELADAKRPDLRWQGNGFDAPVPTELKLADNWTGPELFDRLESQLAGDYLRDVRSNRGIYLLVYRGKATRWQLPASTVEVGFGELVLRLQQRWREISNQFPGVEEIKVIGIDLTKRFKPAAATRVKQKEDPV